MSQNVPFKSGSRHGGARERDSYIAYEPAIEPPSRHGCLLFCFSATIASVVISSPAIEAAPSRAVRTTLVGSIIKRGKLALQRLVHNHPDRSQRMITPH